MLIETTYEHPSEKQKCKNLTVPSVDKDTEQ